jgi:hypothetical protein
MEAEALGEKAKCGVAVTPLAGANQPEPYFITVVDNVNQSM